MIPKIVHYVWLSEDIPPKVRDNIDGWKRLLPDYEIIRWDSSRFDIQSNQWVKCALERKLYAFAADYIRLHALYNVGGIYFDSDVSVVKSFDSLLDLPYFIGFEMTGQIEAATIGAEPKCEWVKKVIDYYKDREFSTKPLTFIMNEIFLENYGIKKIKSEEQFSRNEKQIQVFASEFFSPKHWNCKKIYSTKNTYSIHNLAGSWLPKFSLWRKIKNFIRMKLEIWKNR
jgi:mannosyltransferase OCH1-like enzyme